MRERGITLSSMEVEKGQSGRIDDYQRAQQEAMKPASTSLKGIIHD